MRVLRYKEISSRTREYFLDGRLYCEWFVSGNNDGRRTIVNARLDDIQRLEQILAVEGVHAAQLGLLFDPNAMELHLRNGATWDEVHPRILAAVAGLMPAQQPAEW